MATWKMREVNNALVLHCDCSCSCGGCRLARSLHGHPGLCVDGSHVALASCGSRPPPQNRRWAPRMDIGPAAMVCQGTREHLHLHHHHRRRHQTRPSSSPAEGSISMPQATRSVCTKQERKYIKGYAWACMHGRFFVWTLRSKKSCVRGGPVYMHTIANGHEHDTLCMCIPMQR